ncbi:unnamed protein product, partial [Protopolystoma xenopodis]
RKFDELLSSVPLAPPVPAVPIFSTGPLQPAPTSVSAINVGPEVPVSGPSSFLGSFHSLSGSAAALPSLPVSSPFGCPTFASAPFPGLASVSNTAAGATVSVVNTTRPPPDNSLIDGEEESEDGSRGLPIHHHRLHKHHHLSQLETERVAEPVAECWNVLRPGSQIKNFTTGQTSSESARTSDQESRLLIHSEAERNINQSRRNTSSSSPTEHGVLAIRQDCKGHLGDSKINIVGDSVPKGDIRLDSTTQHNVEQRAPRGVKGRRKMSKGRFKEKPVVILDSSMTMDMTNKVMPPSPYQPGPLSLVEVEPPMLEESLHTSADEDQSHSTSIARTGVGERGQRLGKWVKRAKWLMAGGQPTEVKDDISNIPSLLPPATPASVSVSHTRQKKRRGSGARELKGLVTWAAMMAAGSAGKCLLLPSYFVYFYHC